MAITANIELLKKSGPQGKDKAVEAQGILILAQSEHTTIILRDRQQLPATITGYQGAGFDKIHARPVKQKPPEIELQLIDSQERKVSNGVTTHSEHVLNIEINDIPATRTISLGRTGKQLRISFTDSNL